MKHTMRLLSAFLALTLCFALLPAPALAAEAGNTETTAPTVQEPAAKTEPTGNTETPKEPEAPQDSVTPEDSGETKDPVNPDGSGETEDPVTPPDGSEESKDPVTPPEKQEGTASIHQDSLVFGQGTVAPVVSSDTNTSAPEISYKIQGADDSTYTAEAPTAVGVYTARVIYPETDTHKAAQSTQDFTIRAYITAVTLDPLSVVPSRNYNGQTQPVPLDPKTLPLHFTVEGTTQMPQLDHDFKITSLHFTSPKVDQDPNSLNVVLEISFEDGLYAVAPEVQTSFQLHADILKAPLTVTARDQAIKEGLQEGLDQVTVQGLAEGDALAAVTLKPNAEDTAIIAEGAKILRGEEDVTDQYEITYQNGRLTRGATVDQAPTPQTGLSYNGSSQNLLAAPGTASGGTLVYKTVYVPSQSGEEQLISDWSETLPTGKVPGIYNISYKALGGELKDSEEKTITVTISTKVLKISATAEKVYDGTNSTDNAVITVNFDASQLVPGEDVTIKTIHGSAFPQVGVGKNLKMTPGNAVMEGADAANYTVQITSFGGTIQPKPVTVTCKPAVKKYGQKDPTFTYTAEGLVGGEKLNGSLSRNAGEDVGTYDLTQGTLTNEKNPNYTITFAGNKLTVEKAAMEMKLELSKNRVNAGKPVTIKVTATNAEDYLMSDNWRQPGTLRLYAGDHQLEATYQGNGVWECQYTVPKDAKGSIAVRASAEDSNYVSAEAKATLQISVPGSIPITGDTIMTYAVLLIVSILVLGGLGGWYFIKKKKS